MRELLLTCLFAATAFAQFGSFTHSDDIGAPPLRGSAEFDASTGQYKITGTGTDIWGKADQFHYVWREMSGNFSITATAKFLTEGIAHRKAILMLRKSLDADSPFVHLAIHGDGMPAIQFRNSKADDTNTVDFPVEGPGIWKLKLVRQGTTVTAWIAKDGAALRELGHTTNQLGSPVLVGLGVSSHTQAATNTVLFSDVSVEELPAMAGARSLGIFTHSADVGGPAIKGSVEFSNGQYRVTGSGANMFAKQDQFHYVWREMTGNFTAMATMRFLGQGADHRKAGIMVRQSLDTDSAYADVVIHGSGMPGLQWRSKQGDDTNVFDIPFDGPGTFQIKLVRTGVRIFMYIGQDGAEPKEIAHTEVSFRNPVMVGLAVCSHRTDAADTVVFSDVSVEAQAPQTTDLTISLAGPGPISRHVVKFQCDEHAGALGLPTGPFAVEYLNGAGNSLAVVPIGGHSLIFSSVISGSGARYAADRYIWWDAGSRGVHLYSDSLAGKAEASCHSLRAE
jgi:membrane-bound inhibitor of C-type lysozyme